MNVGRWPESSGILFIGAGPTMHKNTSKAATRHPRQTLGYAKTGAWTGLAAAFLLTAGCEAVIEANGIVQDSTGAPIEGATVSLWPADEDVSKPINVSRTGPSGTFWITETFSPVSSGKSFVIHIEKEGFVPHEIDISRNSAIRDRLIVLSPDSDGS